MTKKSVNSKQEFHGVNRSCESAAGDFIGCTLPPDPKLAAEGWELRFIADTRMARDAVDTYREVGYEVRLVALKADDLKDECSGCKAIFQQFKALYTRKKQVVGNKKWSRNR